MNSVEESVLASMDGTEKDLFPFLPYIFQDVWELGASPEVMIELIQKHFHDYSKLKLIDLVCGKGAVSIKIAKRFKCSCFGIDAVKEFIEEAKNRANDYNVGHLCNFEQGDIRARITELTGYDLVLLGAIGDVFGNYFSTLKKISNCIKPSGKIIIDDAYVEDNSNSFNADFELRSSITMQANKAGMILVDEIVADKSEVKKTEDYIFQKLKFRCEELVEKYPQKRNLFLNYVKNQAEEGEVLKKNVTCSTMLFGIKPIRTK